MFDLGKTLEASVARMPDAIAISGGGKHYTFAEWYADVLRAVAALDQLRLKPGDHIVTCLTNRYETATLHMACQLAALIITPINWRATAEELDYVLADAEARAVVFEAITQATVDQSAVAASIPRITLDTSATATTDWRTIAANDPQPAASRATPDDTSVMLYTSGTTGRGKGVPRSHRAERASAFAHVAQNQYARGEVTLGVMPLYHTMGVRSLLASVLINGHFVCQPRYDAAEALSLIEAERVTNLYLVPTLYHDLLANPAFAGTNTSSVRKLGFAGQSMTDGLLQQLDAAFEPDIFVNHYGSSEVYTFTYDPNAAAKPGSAGKAGLNQDIRIMALGASHPDQLAKPRDEGQIIASLAGDEAFDGYWKRPDADAKSLIDGWYLTGDIGYRDAEGDLFVTGRVDDMMISGGENILPVEIESILSLHEAVSEVAVAGLPDARWGQQVTAFVVAHRPVAADALDQWCLASGLAPFKRPRNYIFIKTLPKSPVGKILRRKLVDGDYTPAD